MQLSLLNWAHPALCPVVAGLCLACCSASVHADIVAQWNFNGSDAPSLGTGSALLVGGATAAFATGSPADISSPNSAWNTSSYPPQGTSNKTTGVEFRVSTRGYSEIQISWEQRLSATASKYLRVQYAADGVNFLDLPQGTIAASNPLSFEHQSVSLADFPEAADNPSLAVRIVSEFESTATGSGSDAYVATYTSNAYGRTGTVRFDLVTISGTLLPGANTPPVISTLPDQVLRVEQSGEPLKVTVSDAQDAPENLLLTAESSDASIVSGVDLEGSGGERSVRVTAGAVPGSARITLTVQDTGGATAMTTFAVAILPTNTAPGISSISSTNLVGGATIEVPVVIADLESAPDALTVTAHSWSSDLVPNDALHLSVGGHGSTRSLTLTPAAGRAGVAVVELTVSDGTLQSSCALAVVVRPAESVLLYDPFAYAEGSLCTNSAGLWQHRSGTNGDCQVRAGALEVSPARTEDVTATLPGGPYAKGRGTVLYAAFQLTFVGAPRATPEYFAHFVGASSLPGRLYASSADTWPGAVRLWVANGTSTSTPLQWVLSPNVAYTVILRYEVDNATTTAWVNATAESEPGTSAHDTQSPLSISGFGFRQDSGLGTVLLVDDLRVGLSFAAVTGTGMDNGIPISIRREADQVILTWADPGAALQFAPRAGDPFTNVPGALSPFTNTITPPAGFFRLSR